MHDVASHGLDVASACSRTEVASGRRGGGANHAEENSHRNEATAAGESQGHTRAGSLDHRGRPRVSVGPLKCIPRSPRIPVYGSQHGGCPGGYTGSAQAICMSGLPSAVSGIMTGGRGLGREGGPEIPRGQVRPSIPRIESTATTQSHRARRPCSQSPPAAVCAVMLGSETGK